MRKFQLWAYCGCVFVAFWQAGHVRAQIITSGSTFQVSGTNFPSSFSQAVSFGSTVLVSGGQLTVTSSLVSANGGAEWVVFEFERVGGGPLANNQSGNWRTDINGVQLNTMSRYGNIFAYWTHDDIAYSPLSPISGTGFTNVTPHPFDAAIGPVYFSNAQSLPTNVFDTFAFINPYTSLGMGGINPSEANGFVIGALITPVPEPSSVALVSSVFGLVGFWRRSRRSNSDIQSE